LFYKIILFSNIEFFFKKTPIYIIQHYYYLDTVLINK